MILYRALLKEDLLELLEQGKIKCTLERSFNDIDNSKKSEITKNKIKEIYDKCYIQKDIDSIYSLVFGHVNGKLVSSAKRSPWISLTSSYDVAYKYANFDKKARRVILCTEISDDIIINEIKDFNKLDITKGAILNLSEDELAKYRRAGLITPYGEDKNIKRTGKNFMISSYSKNDKEYLTCYELVPNNYILLDKEEQDVLIRNSESDIEKEIKEKLPIQPVLREKQLIKKYKSI